MGGVVDAISDAASDTVDFVEDAVSDTADFLEDTVSDAYDFLEDTISDAYEAGSSLAEGSYNLFVESQMDFARQAAKGDFDEAFKSIGENLQKGASAYVDFYREAGTLMIEFSPYFRQADLLGSGSMYSTDYMKDALNGSAMLGKAAIEGNTDALLQLGVMAVAVYLSYGSAAASTGAASSFSIMYSVTQIVAIASFGATIYSSLESLRTLGIISKMDYIRSVMEADEVIKNSTQSYLTSKSHWMAGGMLFNSIYAGGGLFNVTGSRSQARFLSNPDGNSNKRLSRMIGDTHDYSRSLKTHLIGTEDFSVYIFKNK